MNAALVTIGLTAAVAAGWFGVSRYEELRSEVDRIEDRSAGEHLRAALLSEEISEVRGRLDQALGALARTGAAGAELERELGLQAERLSELALEVGEQAAKIAEREALLAELARRTPDPAALDGRFAELDRTLEATCKGLEGRLIEAALRAEEAQRWVGDLDERLPEPRDLDRMWYELVGPVVQLAGESSVGSGVLLASLPAAEGDAYETHLLTAWHVVRDIQGGPDNLALPIPVTIYGEDGAIESETATLLAHDARIDVALLLLDLDRELPCGTALATPERVERVRTFDRVYAVGCPLGNDPIPTYGEIATPRHMVDGDVYWMINAPTFIGNSGGGVFDAETHELLGIFSKIYNYGSLRPTIVPHMGLVTPLTTVYAWLEEVGYGQLVPGMAQREMLSEAAAGG